MHIFTVIRELKIMVIRELKIKKKNVITKYLDGIVNLEQNL